MKHKPGYRPHGTRPVIALGLTALYLLFSVGIIKTTHICMDREASVAYFTSESAKCACSLFADEDDPCCDDTQSVLKLQLSQTNVSPFQLSLPDLSFLGELYSIVSLSEDRALPVFSPHTDQALSPPRLLYKVHCSLVFYDSDTVA